MTDTKALSFDTLTRLAIEAELMGRGDTMSNLPAEYAGSICIFAELVAAEVRKKDGAAPQQAAPAADLEEVLRERDEAEDFSDALLDEVLGHERPEWSSAYGRDHALSDVRERITALHKPAVDKAWDQFQSAMAVPQQAAPAMPSEIALMEKAARRVGITSLLNHGAASCVYSEGCEGVSQEHLLAYTREIALHCAVALAAPQQEVQYDHGPQAETVAEAARDVGKWLNERPNRPLDLRHVAMLAHHATAQPAPQQEVQEPSKRETVDLVGVRSNGEHVNLGKVAMPPRMKARAIAIEQFGGFEDDDGSDAEMCFGALECFLEWLIQQGWSKAQPAPSGDAWKDGDTAALVNELRDAAVQYRDTRQLRERIARIVRPLAGHVQNQPKNEHIAGDVSKSGQESNMSDAEDAARWRFAESSITYAEFRDGDYVNTFGFTEEESKEAVREAIDAARKEGK